jgi:hypothetical protein
MRRKECNPMSLRILFTLSLLVLLSNAYAQYSGGNADGGGLVAAYDNITGISTVYQGGNADGNALVLFSSAISPAIYCLSGDGDGSAATGYLGSTAGPGIYVNGGSGDGQALDWPAPTSISPLGLYCNGGSADGSNSTGSGTSISQPFYCNGGIAEGHASRSSPERFLGQGIWTGYTDTLWTRSSNWKFDLIPGASLAATIQSGSPHYPVINTSFAVNDSLSAGIRCRRFDILNGGSFTTRNTVFINGDVTISGGWQHLNSTPSSFTIGPSGNVLLLEAGQLEAGQ